MEDTGRIRLIIIGIILAVVAGGYFLFTQASRVLNSKTDNNIKVAVATPTPSASGQVVVRFASPTPTATPKNAPAVAGQSTQLAQGTKGGLPATGFPVGLVGIFGTSAAIIGWSLKKYPN
jgi:hypothetical protein